MTSCPACGAPLEVDDRFAAFAVCPSCDSALLVDADAARILGRMGALAAPAGRLRRGASGAVAGRRFRVLGRVRYGYSRGVWDEWFLGFEDGSQHWVSEDEGDLQLEACVALPPLPVRWEDLAPGDAVRIGGEDFRVTEKDIATCEGGEGQLPFPVVAGERVPYLELRAGARFATLEFDPGGARLFRGRQLPPDRLVLETAPGCDAEPGGAAGGPEAVAPAAPGQRARVVLGRGPREKIDCDTCGAPLTVPDPGAESLTCGYCDTTLDLRLDRRDCGGCGKTVPLRGAETTAATCPHCRALVQVEPGSERTRLLRKVAGPGRPVFPLRPGRSGRLRGAEYQVTGILRYRETDDEGLYISTEYFLRGAAGSVATLVRDDAGWSLKTEVTDPPDVDPRALGPRSEVRYGGQTWRVLELGYPGAEVLEWVEGEFTWIPEVGDSGGYADLAAGTRRLGVEWTPTEVEWTRSTALTEAEVFSGFGIKGGTDAGGELVPALRLGRVVAALAGGLALLIVAICGTMPAPATSAKLLFRRPDAAAGAVTGPAPELRADPVAVTLPPLGPLDFGSRLLRWHVRTSLKGEWLHLRLRVLDASGRPVAALAGTLLEPDGVAKLTGKMTRYLRLPGRGPFTVEAVADYGRRGSRARRDPGHDRTVKVEVSGACWAARWAFLGAFLSFYWAIAEVFRAQGTDQGTLVLGALTLGFTAVVTLIGFAFRVLFVVLTALPEGDD